MPRSLPTPASLFLLFLLLCACGAVESLDRLGTLQDDDPVRQDLAPPASPGDALVAIARLEDARDDGGGLLEILAGTFTTRVRTRAVLALGRLPLETHGAEVTRALTAALGDEAAGVRAAAAFALGQRADPASADTLLARWLDAEPSVRVRVIEAASRIDEARLRARVLSALRSPLEAVRCSAAVAPHRWSNEGDQAAETDLALAELAAHLPVGDPRAERLGIPVSGLESPEVLWRALFTLQRRSAEAGRDAYHAHRLDADPRARLFAVKGLAKLPSHEAGRLALEESLGDVDWRVAVEAARGLAGLADHRSLDALEAALGHGSAHVRLAVTEALSDFKVEPARVGALLEGRRGDPSVAVRATALVGEAAVRGALARPLLASAARDPHPVVRGGAALAAGRLPAEHALPLLRALSADRHPRVAGMAISALASYDSDLAHARLVELLGGDDNGLRSAAATALREQPRASDLAALMAAYSAARGDVGPEARVEVLRTAAELGTPEAKLFLAQACSDDHPWVRRVARSLAPAESTGPAAGTAAARTEDTQARAARFEPPPPEPDLPLPGRDYDPNGPHPRVEVVTERGALVFELFQDEAPVHVHNFLTLARAGHYDGLDFHRVVPDFVVQGGCYRGDGNGAGTWRGRDDALRHEFTPRAYVRGSLGMPRGEDPDSGGSQFFVTQRETPHLDGRYTIFGELREGFAVLDALEVGDRILAVNAR